MFCQIRGQVNIILKLYDWFSKCFFSIQDKSVDKIYFEVREKNICGSCKGNLKFLCEFDSKLVIFIIFQQYVVTDKV